MLSADPRGRRAGPFPAPAVLFFALVLVLLLPHLAAPQLCPNRCSGHGMCSGDRQLLCVCGEGFYGNDCSLRSCPTAAAWVAYARDTDDAHTHAVECAGIGTCDRGTGRCACPDGFEGQACEKLACPRGALPVPPALPGVGAPSPSPSPSTTATAPCTNNGRCITMRQAAAGYDGFRLVVPPTAYTLWDADRVQGCLCDGGFGGIACAERQCPLGDDPLTPGVPEVQMVTCSCTGYCSPGYFTLTFAGRTVRVLGTAVARTAMETPNGAPGSGSAPGESVESALAALRDGPTVASVSFTWGATACGANNDVVITFVNSLGNVPEIAAGPGTLTDAGRAPANLVVQTTQQGTTERVPCSGRGTCDPATGTCACYAGFYPSDGVGGPGSVPDCGSPSPVGWTNVTTALNATCPSPTCSGNGLCIRANPSDAPRCSCYAGYAGPACAHRECPRGRAWFDEASAPNQAHAPAVCSARGTCDGTTGLCACQAGFTGAACDRLACQTDTPNVPCSGHGVCLSLRELAERGSFDGQRRGRREVQELTCSLTTGTFTVSLLFSTSPLLPFNIPVADFATVLEALPGVVAVELRPSPVDSPTVCGLGGVVTRVTFVGRDDDVPLLAVAYDPAAGGSAGVTEVVAGAMTTYGNDPDSASTWDADMIFGCHCDGRPDWNRTDAEKGDGSSWHGPTCSLRSCPVGADPLRYLPGAGAGTGPQLLELEVQTLRCFAVATGSFVLTFRGRRSLPISFLDTAAAVKRKLEAAESVGVVNVVMDPPGAVCSGDETATRITFVTEIGDVPGEIEGGKGEGEGE
jgi:hypothetical protein